MPLADFHCHLEHPEFASDLQQVIERACRAGVAKAAVAGSNRLENEKILFLAGRYPEFVVPLIGVSPFDAASMPGQRLSVELDFIRKRAAGIAGIGEIGLDYHYFKEPQERDRQLDAFRRQLQLAESLGLPVAVHSRDAEQDVMNELADFPGLSIMLHCFLKPQLAKKAAACGWLISLPTIKSRDRVKIAKDLDLARLGPRPTRRSSGRMRRGRPCATSRPMYRRYTGRLPPPRACSFRRWLTASGRISRGCSERAINPVGCRRCSSGWTK